jgi:hypothetical protein
MRILYLTHRLPYAPNRGDRSCLDRLAALLHDATTHRVTIR